MKPKKVDDRNIIRDLAKHFKGNKKIISITEEMLPSEAKNILKNGILTITGRMHPSISSFSEKVPAIPLSYSFKYRGIIGRDLGLEELLIDGRNKNMWEKRSPEVVLKKVRFVLKNKKTIEKK